ncbi:hypothetical protein ACSBR1_000109 [Camellia fascicularis]
MPRTKRARPEVGESSNPSQQPQIQSYPTDDFLTESHALAFPNFYSRSIVTGRRVNLPSQYDALLISKLEAMGWQNLINLPQKVYPRLVALFYLHVRATQEEDGNFTLLSYVKRKGIQFDIPTLASIVGVELGDENIHFQTEAELANIVGNATDVFTTICRNRFTGTSLQARHLKPHLRILHRWIVENVTPKKGHHDAVPYFNAYLLYCFEVGQKLDLCYIIMKEMVLANHGQFTGQSLLFGALLTKIFKHFKVNLADEMDIKIRSPITQYTVTRAGVASNLMGSDNGSEDEENEVPEDDAPQDRHANLMPSTAQPQYWTDFLAMEEQRYNQRVQWEQQMSNQVNSLGSQFDTFATAQNSLIQQFGDFRVDIEHGVDTIEHRVHDIYQHYYPSPPPPPPDHDC